MYIVLPQPPREREKRQSNKTRSRRKVMDDSAKHVVPLRFRMVKQSEPSSSQIHELYSQMQVRIVELEKALANIPAGPAGMGHNQPPEPLEIDLSDIEEGAQSVGALKTQPELPPDKGDAALEAVISIEEGF
jgi:hypothetical protein